MYVLLGFSPLRSTSQTKWYTHFCPVGEVLDKNTFLGLSLMWKRLRADVSNGVCLLPCMGVIFLSLRASSASGSKSWFLRRIFQAKTWYYITAFYGGVKFGTSFKILMSLPNEGIVDTLLHSEVGETVNMTRNLLAKEKFI